MRLAIANYLTINEKEILKTDKFLYIKNLIPEEYLNSKDKSINLELFKEERLITKSSEADFCILGIAAFLFEVELEVNVLEGFCKEKKENLSEVKILKKKFPSRINNSSTKKISMMYRNSRWSVIYKNDSILLIEDFLTENKLMNLDKLEDKFISIDFECEKCKQLSKIIYIEKYLKYCFCLFCLKKHIDEVMEKRKKIFIKSNFLDKECKLNFI